MNIKLYVSEFLWFVYPINRVIFQHRKKREGVNYKKANVRSFLLTMNRFSYMTQLNQARVIQLSWSTKA